MTPTTISRIDSNQPAIVEALRAAGATVQHLHTIGHGCPDILVGFRGVNYLFEIKHGSGRVTADEQDWLMTWCGQSQIVRSATDALRAIGALE